MKLWLRAEWTRFASGLPSAKQLGHGLQLLGWFSWPLWPIAGWGLWRARRRLRSLPTLLPLLSALLVAITWMFAGDHSQASALPMLPALALLAAGGVHSLRRGAANAFDWFSLISLAVFGILVWLAWSAQSMGWPPGLARHVARNAPDFILPDPLAQMALGAAITLAWIALLWKLPRTTARAPANWAIGLTMLWCLAVVLLMPWFDNARSYRTAVQSLAIAVDGERSTHPDACVASIRLPGHLRSSLDYFAGLRTHEVVDSGSPCPLLLLTGEEAATAGLAPEWQVVWEFQRGAGRRAEQLLLFRREPSPASMPASDSAVDQAHAAKVGRSSAIAENGEEQADAGQDEDKATMPPPTLD